MLDGKFASIEERLEAVAHAAPEDFHSRMEELKDAVGYEEFLDIETEALREAIQNPDTSRADEMFAFAEQAEQEYVAELARETTVESPDDFLTGETIKTTRGTFYVTDRTQEQMESAGYGIRHDSDDQKCRIM